MALQQPPVECWDDDLTFEGDINFADSQSTAYKTSVSVSSRQSIRSESNAGDDDWQLPLPTNDGQRTTSQAISSAKLAGIPIPTNIPASALVGGSIKRLGKKKSNRNLEEDWDNDLQFPGPGEGELKVKKVQRAPSLNLNDNDEFDDWAEGSLGIRNAGKRPESKHRESSTSAVSPSMGSCITFESEEDGLDGLEIPTGPLDFQAALKKIKDEDDSKERAPAEQSTVTPLAAPSAAPSAAHDKEDDINDLDFGPGDVFDPKKRAINRNIKQTIKTTHHSSPQTKPLTTLTFTDKPTSTRLPRPVQSTKPASRLEPVFESGATNVTRPRRSEAAANLGSAQMLRSKRSMPALRSAQGLTKQPSVPSLPTHLNFSKHTPRPQFHGRHGSDPNRASSPVPRPSSISRAPPDTPTRSTRRDVAPATLAREAAAKRTVTRPSRRRNFGDGTELEDFDDLPTSATKEQRFVKPPSSRPPPSSLRTQIDPSRLASRDKMTTPMPPATPKSPSRALDNLPRFARDTAASRIARESKLKSGATNSLGVPVAKRSDSVLATRTNWPAQVAARTPNSSPVAARLARKGPTLINPGKENSRQWHDDAAQKGMHWNANLLRWEGNEAAVKHFEHPSTTPSLQYANNQSHHPPAPPSPPRPALITNMAAGAQPGIQVSGHMVFDPHQMRWLKMGRVRAGSVASNPMSPSAGEATEEDDDPFKGIDDLKDDDVSGTAKKADGPKGGVSIKGVAEGLKEEFDLGPVFIDRQKDEEAVWRTKIGGWFPEDGTSQRDKEGDRWKWAIRDIAAQVQM